MKKGRGWRGNSEAHARCGKLGGLTKGVNAKDTLVELNKQLKKENKAIRTRVKAFCGICSLQKKGYCLNTDCELYEVSPFR